VDVVLGYLAALAVATATGLNAYLPLLLVGLLSRSTVDRAFGARSGDRTEEPARRLRPSSLARRLWRRIVPAFVTAARMLSSYRSRWRTARTW
jgi:hypothetical protein